jgi:hypothetical protein
MSFTEKELKDLLNPFLTPHCIFLLSKYIGFIDINFYIFNGTVEKLNMLISNYNSLININISNFMKNSETYQIYISVLAKDNDDSPYKLSNTLPDRIGCYHGKYIKLNTHYVVFQNGNAQLQTIIKTNENTNITISHDDIKNINISIIQIG